jgi:arsenate reductase
MTQSKRVLILCTGNSCRSQMAERIWENVGAGTWQCDSAGSKPSGYVHPLALVALQEIELSVEGLSSKSIDEFADQEFDLVVTVCDNAKGSCPTLPGRQALHWPFDDPADAEGTDDEKLAVFRRVRDEISAKIKAYLASSQP